MALVKVEDILKSSSGLTLGTLLDNISHAPKIDEKDVETLPCKIGDRMWCIRDVKGVLTAQEGIVHEMMYRKDMSLLIVIKYVGRGLYGEKVFRTKEDCEAKIKELNEKDEE